MAQPGRRRLGSMRLSTRKTSDGRGRHSGGRSAPRDAGSAANHTRATDAATRRSTSTRTGTAGSAVNPPGRPNPPGQPTSSGPTELSPANHISRANQISRASQIDRANQHQPGQPGRPGQPGPSSAPGEPGRLSGSAWNEDSGSWMSVAWKSTEWSGETPADVAGRHARLRPWRNRLRDRRRRERPRRHQEPSRAGFLGRLLRARDERRRRLELAAQPQPDLREHAPDLVQAVHAVPGLPDAGRVAGLSESRPGQRLPAALHRTLRAARAHLVRHRGQLDRARRRRPVARPHPTERRRSRTGGRATRPSSSPTGTTGRRSCPRTRAWTTSAAR